MTVFRNQFIPLLEPILDDVRNDDSFPRAPEMGAQLYARTKTSTKATETVFERAGLGALQEKPEGQKITFSDPISGEELKFTHIRRALAYQITQEMLDHDQFDEIAKLERDLQIALDYDVERRRMLLLNNGFGTTNDGGFRADGYDGLALFSTAHTRLDGGPTQRNRPSTDVNLSWVALADARQQFKSWFDHRGREVTSVPSQLWVSPADELTAMELVRSTLKPGTANNEINAIQGDFQIMVSQLIDDTNSWYVMGSDMDTIWYWDTGGPRTASIMEDDLREIVGRKAVHGNSNGHGHWFGTYGSSGVS